MANRRPINRVTTKRQSVESDVPTPELVESDEDAEVSSDLTESMTDDTAPAGSAKEFAPKSRGRLIFPRIGPGRNGSWRQVAAAATAALVLGGFAVFAATHPGVNDANSALIDSASTDEVKAAGVHALLTIYGYDVTTIDGYDTAVRGVVTGQMLTDLNKFSATTVDAIRQAQTSVQAAADPVGVAMLTADHAELLVNLTVAAAKDGVAQQSVSGTVVLRMRKVNDTWLASEILDR
ncbi:hypothetical protein ACFU44_20225 [Nocardia rhizosphaerihabitans]|uniref:hypothetical protein n=1 Tax=Nocardia rhizosphaerihabitans TaxID=1691570 RepID=UPI00366F8A04